MYDKVVSLGSRLHYPITITKLLKSSGEQIKKQETIFEYKFHWKRKINDDEWANETTYTEYDSPADGVLKEWRIREGMDVAADTACMMVEEACGHEVQMNGLCSLCGADMTEVNWASEERDTDRAMVNMTHDQTGLMVSQDVAQKAEHDTQKRLLRQRKLSLVVDLDQTIIHACIDPTVGEWQSDPSNPNYEAVKDVKSFQLNEEGPRGVTNGCTYYIKLRPGLRDFLEEVSQMYELHVYTMGTRAYALNIARIVDPDKKLFGNRVISRDENGNIHAKSLQRLFPVSTDMVVIIDDRSDVWPMNRPNLIKVVPYDFFKGIGDINSSFLPRRTDIAPISPAVAAAANGTATAEEMVKAQAETPEKKPSPIDELARMGGDDNANIKEQAKEQEKTLEKQLTDRPLQHMQEELDKEEERGDENNGEAPGSSPHHHRQNLLQDDDEELIALQDHLTDLHGAFYDTYDKRRRERKQSDPEGAHLPGQHNKLRRKSADDGVDLSMVPDAGDLLDELKSNVLSGLVLVLSGLIPLGVKIEESEIGLQAQSFGAQVLDTVSKRVTHLVVSTERPRTRKVQQAARISSIRIVSQNWLTDCLSQWRRLDERPYYLDVPRTEPDKSAAVTELASDDEEAASTDTGDIADIDWAAAEEDLRELLEMGDDDSEDDQSDGSEGATKDKDNASEAGDSDMVSDVASDAESSTAEDARASRGTKRKALADDGESGSGSGPTESTLAKKQRLARERGTSALRSMRNFDDEEADKGSTLPTRGPMGEGGDGAGSSSNGAKDAFVATNGDDEDDGGFDDDLERDLWAELDAAGD